MNEQDLQSRINFLEEELMHETERLIVERNKSAMLRAQLREIACTAQVAASKLEQAAQESNIMLIKLGGSS